MKPTSRLLGLAFASADTLIEIDAAGLVAFAAGAAADPKEGVEAWIGRPFFDLIAAADRTVLAQALGDLSPGVRSGRMPVHFRRSDDSLRPAFLRVFRLPELGPVLSCAVSWEGDVQLPRQSPLATPSQFLDRARDILTAAADDARIGLTFVDVPGLAQASETAGLRVQADLQAASRDGRTATRLTPERFALLRDGDQALDVIEQVRRAGEIDGVAFEPICAEVSLAPGRISTVNALRALRFTIEGCLRSGDAGRPDLAFGEHLKRTLSDADRFNSVVKTRQFDLHWQPIVDLGDRSVHHFEGLTRFGPGAGPAPLIHMAEELGLIEAFDLAVAEKAVGRLMAPGGRGLTLAVNVSAHSLAGDAYVTGLLQMTRRTPGLRRQLMVEVTETAALADVEAADRRLATLREAGVRACIDDFGAGAASFDWLRGLAVDMVKIDGGFVRRLDKDPRTSTLIGHLVSLCDSLNVRVIGEMIEDEACAERLHALGVDFGQGWLFGRPHPEPTMRDDRGPTGRRRGLVESWR